jgi:hypothetical protein
MKNRELPLLSGLFCRGFLSFKRPGAGETPQVSGNGRFIFEPIRFLKPDRFVGAGARNILSLKKFGHAAYFFLLKTIELA